MLYSFLISLSTILLLFLILQNSNSAKHCYSGQNKRYIQKQCSSGSLAPFVLRTCAPKSAAKCNAGSRICLFSKGKQNCEVCNQDFCNE
uniref:Uncharacterized protein n=1 Tax=Meloidogyne hapla TaxID=6305 RepID=A0A1I8AXS8_MELHA